VAVVVVASIWAGSLTKVTVVVVVVAASVHADWLKQEAPAIGGDQFTTPLRDEGAIDSRAHS
jgi:hypothetical protein